MIRKNLSDYVAYWAEVSPEREALVYGERRISYREFDQLATRLAAGLEALGVARGDRVAIQLTTLPEYILLYMGIARRGAVMVGINPLYTADEVAYLLEVTRPRLLVSAPPFVERLEQAMARVPVERRVLLGGGPAALGGEAPGWMPWEEFVNLGAAGGGAGAARGPGAVRREWPTDPDDPVLIVFTSGTTGKPRGAVLSHRNIISNIAVEVRHFHLSSSDRMVIHLPMNHVGGATEMTIGAIIAGATMLVLDRFHPQKTLELVARERATFLGQVPTMFIMELNLPDFERYDLSSLERLAVAGAPTPTEVMKRMLRIAPVITGYGMTEVAGFVTYTELEDDPETVCRTVGRAAPEFELKVVGAAGQELPTGETGEVVVRGPCVTRGYYGDEAATREAIDAENWYHTGDMGYLDKRGYLTLAGRKQEMYITGGYNVYPPEVEEALSQHPDVLLAACVGVPDPVLGEVGRAFVVFRPGRAVEAEALRAHLAGRLAEYKIPRYFEFKESLPMTPLGKVDKKLLR